MINYERMKHAFPKQKAALARATKLQKSTDLETQTKYYPAVLNACRAAVTEWNEIGAWPDGWVTWKRALEAAAFFHARATGFTPKIFHLSDL